VSDTREKLLLAAERLFATKGIDATRVRDVNALAGQRNTSAIRYHFDDRSGLLASLIEQRMGELDHARGQALEKLGRRPAGQAIEVEDYVGVLVAPLAERVHADAAWACWVRVLAQLISVRGHEHRSLWEGRYDRATRHVFRRIRPLVPDVPDDIWLQRVEDLTILCIGSLCERAGALEQGRPAVRLDAQAFTANLIRVASAVLRAR